MTTGWKTSLLTRLILNFETIMDSEGLTADLGWMIKQLSLPVSAREAEEGWTPQAKAGIAAYFKNQHERLVEKRQAGESGLVRGLDAWGVSDGILFDAALRINRELLDQRP